VREADITNFESRKPRPLGVRLFLVPFGIRLLTIGLVLIGCGYVPPQLTSEPTSPPSPASASLAIDSEPTIDVKPTLVKHAETGPAAERTYIENLSATDVIVGSASQFNGIGPACQIFLVVGPRTDFRFVLFDGEYFVYSNVFNVPEQDQLVQKRGIDRADELRGCRGRESVTRMRP
jgi:hypothetical protein